MNNNKDKGCMKEKKRGKVPVTALQRSQISSFDNRFPCCKLKMILKLKIH